MTLGKSTSFQLMVKYVNSTNRKWKYRIKISKAAIRSAKKPAKCLWQM